MKVIRGKVVKGINERSRWMNKLESYYTSKTGIRLFPGSIQIQLLDYCKQSTYIHKNSMNKKDECYQICYVNGIKVYYMEPMDSTFRKSSQSIIEIVSDLDLIKSLRLSEGEEVEVMMPIREEVLLH
ncbi:DUF120 domain-containing protein [Bacillus pinisoli]|uniref:DUF120 domain-containing protein n=1 Tax=Bacillus pinisoli TaxID=2901866 RepID=UPI001FF1C9AD|nr:DUF120 domain-containing protein [Bacillus pinisoli]